MSKHSRPDTQTYFVRIPLSNYSWDLTQGAIAAVVAIQQALGIVIEYDIHIDDEFAAEKEG